MRNRCCYWANLPANSSGECAALDKLAEGEELGSNLLQVPHRRPTELGGLGKVAGAPPALPGSKGRETAILPRGGP
jgi:hypothetical protein